MDSLFEDRGNYCWPKGFWLDYNHMEDSIDTFMPESGSYEVPERIKKLKQLVDK